MKFRKRRYRTFRLYIARPSRPGASATWSAANRTGFTLLEIILSLAILAGSLVALGEVMRLGDQNAINARDETTAEILASSVMDELLSGARQLQAATNQPFDYEVDPPFTFSVIVESTSYTQVLRVGVRVEQTIEAQKEPINYEIYRWIVNPDYVTQVQDEEAQIAATAAEAATRAATSSVTTTTTGAGGTTGGAATGGGS